MNRKVSGLPPQTAGTDVARPPDAARERQRASFSRLRVARRLAARLKALRRRRAVLLAVALIPVALLLVPAAWLVHHVYFDRAGVPDLEAFIRFEPPTTGVVCDAHGNVLIELAREYRRVVTYDEVPLILRQAILAAEDKRFFSHSGVDYRVLPRVVQKTAARSVGRMVEGRPRVAAAPAAGRLDAHAAARPRLLSAGPDEPPRRRRALPRGPGPAPAPLRGPGSLRHEQAPSEDGGGAPDALARGGDAQTVWIAGAGQARDLRALRQLHLPGQRPLRLRRRLRVLLRQAPVELYAGRRGQRGAPGCDQQGAA